MKYRRFIIGAVLLLLLLCGGMVAVSVFRMGRNPTETERGWESREQADNQNQMFEGKTDEEVISGGPDQTADMGQSAEAAREYTLYRQRFEAIQVREDIAESGFEIVENQVFPVEMEHAGEVSFIPAYDTEYRRLALFFADESGDIIYKTDQLETNSQIRGSLAQPNEWLAAVSFQDMDNDGMTDIVMITACSYSRDGQSGSMPAGSEASGQSAAEASGQSAAEAPGRPAAEASGQPAAEASGQSAAEASGQPAAEAPGQAAAEASGQPAAEAPGQSAAEAPGPPAANASGPPADGSPSSLAPGTAAGFIPGIYKVGDVLFQKNGAFYRDYRLSDQLNRFGMNKSIRFITSFIRDGYSTEFLYTATTQKELLDHGFRIAAEQYTPIQFEKLGRLYVVPGTYRMAEYTVFMIYLVNEEGYIVWSFQPMGDYESLYGLRGVSCQDIDGDGLKDIVVLASYSFEGMDGQSVVENGYSVYYQRTAGFYEDTDIKQTISCTDSDTMSDLVERGRAYWGWKSEQ